MKTVRISCPQCGEKFFVVSRAPAVCPMCGAGVVSTGELVERPRPTADEPDDDPPRSDQESNRLVGIVAMILAMFLFFGVASCGLLGFGR